MEPKPIIVASRFCFQSIRELTEDYCLHTPMPVSLTMADGAVPKPTIGTDIRIDFTDEGLIVLFRGKYESLHHVPLPSDTIEPGASPKTDDDGDFYECSIGPNVRQTGSYRIFRIAPDGRCVTFIMNRSIPQSDGHWQAGCAGRSFVNAEAKVWSAALSMPWNCFTTDYRSDCEWNANLYRATGRYHGDERLAWSAAGYGERAFHRDRHFGRIIFEK